MTSMTPRLCEEDGLVHDALFADAEGRLWTRCREVIRWVCRKSDYLEVTCMTCIVEALNEHAAPCQG